MRSGWPTPQDEPGRHTRRPSQQRQAPYGPEASWPGGRPSAPGTDYQDGYGYRSARALPEPSGGHPYASYDDASYAAPARDSFGYGDPGYSDPGYNGPSAQDAGIPGTRTVRGFVEAGQPAYSQTWDYDMPLRYDDEPTYPGSPSGAYQMPEGYRTPPSLSSRDRASSRGYDSYGNTSIYGTPLYDSGASGRHSRHAAEYRSDDYNGSELSRPGVDGPGYDLSGIISADEFPSFSYDEPGAGRLSYDDPRYDDRRGRGPNDSWGGRRRLDETSIDSFWPGDGHPSGGYPSVGDGGTVSRVRATSSQPALPRGGAAPRNPSSQTRLDLGFRADEVSAYAPRFDETRLDDMRALSEAPAARGRSATGVLTAPATRPRSWAEETSLDSFDGLGVDDLAGLREEPSRAAATALREAPQPPAVDAPPRRGRGGRRRGRSSDRRQWMALGAIAVVAIGSIGVALKSFVFNGPSGPQHTISTPAKLASYQRSPNLEQAVNMAQLQAEVTRGSSGTATDVVSAVYAAGSTTPGSANQQVFMFIGGHLPNDNPADSIKSFEQDPSFANATIVSPGALGGEAACTTSKAGSDAISICVFFDDDSFGTFVSPTMTPEQLASTMVQVRPGIEHVTK